MSKWISVADRLPKIGRDVLVLSEHGQIGVGHICVLVEDQRFVIWCGDGIDATELTLVTHWCKLPKMPKKKNGECES